MKTKLVGFDWDGTLARMQVTHSWSAVNKLLNCEPEMSALEKKFHAKEINFLKWCEESINVYKRLGLTKEKLESAIASNLVLHEGALETINELRSRGIKVCIISGGIYNMYEYASRKFGLNVDYVSFAAKLNFDDQGRLADCDFNDYDYEGKLVKLKMYCAEAGCSLDEVIYVGDADNDIEVFKVSTGVACLSDSETLKKYAKHVIKGNDMRAMLQYFE
jgi:phosphoserine phosphatase